MKIGLELSWWTFRVKSSTLGVVYPASIFSPDRVKGECFMAPISWIVINFLVVQNVL